jgi:hypothetical protein
MGRLPVDREKRLTKEKAGCWTLRKAFEQVRRSSNIQLLSYSLVAGAIYDRPGRSKRWRRSASTLRPVGLSWATAAICDLGSAQAAPLAKGGWLASIERGWWDFLPVAGYVCCSNDEEGMSSS